MAEPTSWLTIESGWDVVGRSGAVIGRVARVVGDPDADIFDGLRLETSEGSERYVPADQVGGIVEGRVTVDLELTELDEPTSSEEPGGVEVHRDRDAEL
jgi:hypothetical protein